MLTLEVSLWTLQQIAPVVLKQRGVHGGGKVHDLVSGVCLPLVEVWNWVIFRIPSNLSHSMILWWVLDILHSSGGEQQWWWGCIPPWSWGPSLAIFTCFLDKTCFYSPNITPNPSAALVIIKGCFASHSGYLGLLDLYRKLPSQKLKIKQ